MIFQKLLLDTGEIFFHGVPWKHLGKGERWDSYAPDNVASERAQKLLDENDGVWPGEPDYPGDE